MGINHLAPAPRSHRQLEPRAIDPRPLPNNLLTPTPCTSILPVPLALAGLTATAAAQYYCPLSPGRPGRNGRDVIALFTETQCTGLAAQTVLSPLDSRMCVRRLEIPACSAIRGAALSGVQFTSEDSSGDPFIGSISSTASDQFCFGASPVVVRSLLCQNVDAPRD